MNKAVLLSLFSLLSLSLTSIGHADLAESRQALVQLSQNVHKVELSNGLRVLMYQRSIAPVFAGTVTVRVGGTDEKEGQTGISHMLEHMAFKGTKTLGTKDFKREARLLEELEAFEIKRKQGEILTAEEQSSYNEIHKELTSLWVLGEFSQQYEKRGATGMNATTSNEFTRYFVELPRDAFEWWCAIESERILYPVMRQFYEERDVVMEERRMRIDDNPQSKLYELLLGTVYRLHPYRNPVIGYPNDIKRVTASEVLAFHKKYYVPSNIVVAVVGDIHPEEDRKVLERYFGRIPVGPAVDRPTVVEPKQEGERRVVLESKAAPLVSIVYHKPNYPHPDDAPITLFGQVFAGSTLSPLYTDLVKKTQRAADVLHEEGPGSAYPNFLMFSFIPRSPTTPEELITSFDTSLKRFLRGRVSDDMLLRAKRSVAMDYLGNLKNSKSLALELASSELMYGDWKAPLEWYEKAMLVTPEDILRVGKTYFVESNRSIGVLQTKR